MSFKIYKIKENRLIKLKDSELEKGIEKQETEEANEKEKKEPSYEEKFFELYNEKLKEWTNIANTQIQNKKYKQTIEEQIAHLTVLVKGARNNFNTDLDIEEFKEDFEKIEYKIEISIAKEEREKLIKTREQYAEVKEKFKNELFVKRQRLIPEIQKKLPENIPEDLFKNINFRIKQELKNLGKIFLVNLEEFDENTEEIESSNNYERMREVRADLENYIAIMESYFSDADLNRELKSLNDYIDSINFLISLDQNLDKTVQIILQNSPGQGRNVERAKNEIRRLMKKRIMKVTLKEGSSEDIIKRRIRLEEKIIVAYIADRTGFKRHEIYPLLNHKSKNYDPEKMEGKTMELLLAINADPELKKFNIRIEGEADANGVKRINRSSRNMVRFIMNNEVLRNYPTIKNIIDKYPDEFKKIAGHDFEKFKEEIERSSSFRAYDGLGNELVSLKKAFKGLDIDFRRGEPGEKELNLLIKLLESDHEFKIVNIVQTDRRKRGENNKGSRIMITSISFPKVDMDYEKFKSILLGITESEDDKDKSEDVITSEEVINYLNKDAFSGREPNEKEIIQILTNLKDEDIKNLPEKVVQYVVDHHERFPKQKEKIYKYYVRKRKIEEENKCYKKVYEKMKSYKSPTKENFNIRVKYERAKGINRIIDLELNWLDDYPKKLKSEYINTWIENYEFLQIDRKNLLDTISFSKSSGLKNEKEFYKAKNLLEVLKRSNNPKASILEGEIIKSINRYLNKETFGVEPARIRNIYDQAMNRHNLPQDRIPLLKAFLPPDGTFENMNPTDEENQDFQSNLMKELAWVLYEENDFEEINRGVLGIKIMETLSGQKGKYEYIYRFIKAYSNANNDLNIEKNEMDYLLKNAEIEDKEKLDELAEKLLDSQINQNKTLGKEILKKIKF